MTLSHNLSELQFLHLKHGTNNNPRVKLFCGLEKMFSKCLNRSRYSIIVNFVNVVVPYPCVFSTHCSHATNSFSLQAPVTLYLRAFSCQLLLGAGWKCQEVHAPRSRPFNQRSMGVDILKLLSCSLGQTEAYFIYSPRGPPWIVTQLFSVVPSY